MRVGLHEAIHGVGLEPSTINAVTQTASTRFAVDSSL